MTNISVFSEQRSASVFYSAIPAAESDHKLYQSNTATPSADCQAPRITTINTYRQTNERYSLQMEKCVRDLHGADATQATKSAAQFVALATKLGDARQLEVRQLLGEWNESLLSGIGEKEALALIQARDHQTPTPYAASIDDAEQIIKDEEYPISSWQLGEKLAESIKDMDESYLKVFQQAVEKYNKFFSDFSDELISKLSQCIDFEDDKTILQGVKLKTFFDEFLKKYKVNPPNNNATLFPAQSGKDTDPATEYATKDECNAWAKQFGLNEDNCVKKIGEPDKYVVTIDISPIKTMSESFKPESDQKLNAAQWTAWQTGFDQQKSNVQTHLQAIVQKYSGANSVFENLVKILSGTISSLLDADKSFFNI